MARVKVTFERKGTFTMKGGAEIEIDDPEDYSELYLKGCRKEFKSYLPTEINYDDEEWDFEFLEEKETA